MYPPQRPSPRLTGFPLSSWVLWLLCKGPGMLFCWVIGKTGVWDFGTMQSCILWEWVGAGVPTWTFSPRGVPEGKLTRVTCLRPPPREESGGCDSQEAALPATLCLPAGLLSSEVRTTLTCVQGSTCPQLQARPDYGWCWRHFKPSVSLGWLTAHLWSYAHVIFAAGTKIAH